MDVIELVNTTSQVPLDLRIFRDRLNPMEHYSDNEFFEMYRMRKPSFLLLCSKLSSYIENDVPKRQSLQPIQTLALGISFMATGSFFNLSGKILGVHRTTAMRAAHKTVDSILRLRTEYVKFPTQPQDVLKEKELFYQKFQFPGVVSAIDCTHVKIKKPTVNNPEIYRNRKGYFSINVQACCTANLIFTNIVARWPGSTHDSRIFMNSTLCANFESNAHDGILLGDSGYACRRYLLTPVLRPQDEHTRRYNRAQIRSRNVIERCFGILKHRFQCLLKGMIVRPVFACRIIVACVILHNFLSTENDLFDIDVTSNDSEVPQTDGGSILDGLQFRQQFILNHF